MTRSTGAVTTGRHGLAWRSACIRQLIIFLIFGAFLNGADPVRAEIPDRQVLRDRLKLIWDSLASFEIDCEEYSIDAKGGRDLARAHTENHFCYKRENLWFSDMRVVMANGVRKPSYQIRQDGSKQQQIGMFKDFPTEISNVNIKNQVSTPLEYAEAKFSALWLFLPGGKPPYVYLDQGASISEAKEYGPSCVAIDAIHRNHPLRLILDSDHDWLPLRVESIDGDDVHVHEVTNFARDNNRWFPSEGTFVQPSTKGPVRRLFVVSRIRINREVDESLFRLPPLPNGVRVSNDITGKVSFEGSEAAYQQRESRYRAADQKQTRDQAAVGSKIPILADRSSSGWPWSEVIVGTFAGLLLIAVGLWWRAR